MSDRLQRVVRAGFWSAQGISLLSIVHDLTTQELLREKMARGELTLGPAMSFLNDHFVGDVGNAYAAVLLPSVVCEFVNLEIQKANVEAWVKDISRVVTVLSPYIMSALFLLAAYNVEMSTNIFQAGTSNPLDYVGAVWGVATALPATVCFNRAVFPKKASQV